MVYKTVKKGLIKDIIDKGYTRLYKVLYEAGEEARYIIRMPKITQSLGVKLYNLKSVENPKYCLGKLFLVYPLTFWKLYAIL